MLTGDNPIVFGAGKDVDVFIEGERIVDKQFEIVFDNNTLMIKNLNLDCW